jgi:two-component system sensor histidine kinase QseC
MPFVKRAWANSLSARMIAAYVTGVVLSALVIVLAVKGLLTFRSPIFVEEDMGEHAEALAEHLAFDAAGAPIGFDNRLQKVSWIFQTMKDDLAYRVLDSAGRVVFQSQDGAALWPAEGGTVGRPQQGRFAFDHAGKSIRGATAVVEHGDRTWFIQMAASTRLAELLRLEFALPFMGVGIMLFSAVLLFVFGVCTYVMLRQVQKPLQAVSASAAAISPQSLHARLPSESVPTEIAPLVESFNRVLERVERGYRVQQEFLATAAHELKTPLALIRAQVELLEANGDRDALLSDVEHMTRQVQQLLLLAEASEAHNYEFAPTNVGDVAREAAGYLRRMARTAGVAIELVDSGDAGTWHADRGALFTLFKNLLENAIQHAPAGTVVSIAVQRASLSVRDQGPGVEAGELPKLFARFWRGAHRRDHGAGLGLAICQEIAQAHGWVLSVQPAEPGLRLVVSTRPDSSEGVFPRSP